MAGHGPLEPAAQAGAVDGGHHRASGTSPAGRSRPARRGRAPAASAAPFTSRSISIFAPATKPSFLPLGDHDGLHGRVLLQRVEHRGELGAGLPGEGVHRLAGHVHEDRGHAVLDLDPEVLPVTRGSCQASGPSRTTAAPIPPAAQTVSSAWRPLRRASSRSAWVIMRAPVAPNG